jgi:hypothetical protein
MNSDYGLTVYPPKTIKVSQKIQGFIYKGIKTLGITGLLAGWIIFSWTFVTAYFSSSKSVLVSINKYGEGQMEYILLWVLFLPTLYIIARLLYREGRNESI